MNILKLATLANLPVSDKEVKTLEKQLSETIGFIDHLKEVNTGGVIETSQVTGKINELREDKVTPGLSQDKALKNAPQTKNGFFVSKIIWE